MIIYPPFIADTIPAFTTEIVIIPFQQNPAVDWDEVEGFSLIIKNYNDSKPVAYLSVNKEEAIYNPEVKNGYIEFNFNSWKPEIKQYYKFQLAYTDNTEEEYAYSSASIGRCIGVVPTISIVGDNNQTLNPNAVNFNTSTYIGKYSTSILSEPIYSYRFLFSTATGEVIQDTGEIFHNVDNDIIENNNRYTEHVFNLKYELDNNVQYNIKYFITTINGYKIETPFYPITKANEIPSGFRGGLNISQNAEAKDNGYLLISLWVQEPQRGNFVIERTSDGKKWDQLLEFSITKLSNIPSFVWKDWSIEQGVKYTYALRQKTGNIYSERILSNSIEAEFQDMFLSDGKRQLKIQFNPKVSSFKNTILEQKTDTIGSQYPFFFRNNNVKYKEIPISGLISYLMDDARLFMTNKELGMIDDLDVRKMTEDYNVLLTNNAPTTQLTNNNYIMERKFKLEVLEWLTNGELKLFRSPAEGNYVIRLMNVSLSPNDTLGRLIHTFSATGYQAGNSDIESLIKNNLMHFDKPIEPKRSKKFETIDLQLYTEKWGNVPWQTYGFKGAGIENIYWYSCTPNTSDRLVLIDENGNEEVYVNSTGLFTTPPGVTFDKITIIKDSLLKGSISFQINENITEEDKGEDIFENVINNSIDNLFSLKAGTTAKLTNKGEIWIDKTVYKIYKIHSLTVRKDPNYISDTLDDFYLTFDNNNIIDCSDGQIRQYYALNPSMEFLKGKGLHIDIYARIGKEEK